MTFLSGLGAIERLEAKGVVGCWETLLLLSLPSVLGRAIFAIRPLNADRHSPSTTLRSLSAGFDVAGARNRRLADDGGYNGNLERQLQR